MSPLTRERPNSLRIKSVQSDLVKHSSSLPAKEIIPMQIQFQSKCPQFPKLLDKSTNYIKNLANIHPAIHRQFIASLNEKINVDFGLNDPLLEDEHMVVKGLVHKYGNRALVLLTMNCGAYCRFCTRKRKVSDIKEGLIEENHLDNMVNYLKDHPEIHELVISGGDPLTVPHTLKLALEKFSQLPQIKIFRVGTRLPGVNPRMINQNVINALNVVKDRPLYLMLHFEHPAELTTETILALKRLRPVVTMMFSQSVFLKGVNDSYETLYELFSNLLANGVKPYYIYHCDPVKGAEHFIVPIKEEVAIMTKLRKNLSGLAYPLHVIDTPDGSGKIPIPLNFWQYNDSVYGDFNDEMKKTME